MPGMAPVQIVLVWGAVITTILCVVITNWQS